MHIRASPILGANLFGGFRANCKKHARNCTQRQACGKEIHFRAFFSIFFLFFQMFLFI